MRREGRSEKEWGKLDFVIHAIAFAPHNDLHGRVGDVSAEGFARAMHVSCWSFVRMAKLAEQLMKDGGVLITLSYYGAEKVVNRYNVMGPVKVALEASVRYMSAELGPKEIRMFAVSPGPLKTRAASGISHFEGIDLMDLPAPMLPHPERPFSPREPRVAAAAGRRDRREHTAGLRIDLLDAILGDLKQVLAVEGRSCMRGNIDRTHSLPARRIEGVSLSPAAIQTC